MFASDRYLNRLAAIEAYDRKKAGCENSGLRTRLKRCTDFAGTEFAGLVRDVNAWIDHAYRERLDLAHHYDWRLRETGADLYYLAESAYWLFILCLLREATIPDAVFRRAVTTPGFRWLQRKLSSVVS